MAEYLLIRAKRHLREHGIIATTRAAIRHGRKGVGAIAEGTPGYYRVHQLRLRLRYDDGDITPRLVSPDAITSLTGTYQRCDTGHLDYVRYFKPRENRWTEIPYQQEVPYGSVLGGDWDVERAPFEQLLMYKGAKQRFVDGHDWEKTVYFEELVQRYVDRGTEETTAIKLARARCECLDELYRTLKKDGYRSQRELHGHPLHEVTVNIGRDGELLFNSEGRNRLCLAKILDIDKIPVLLLVRHKKFSGKLPWSSG